MQAGCCTSYIENSRVRVRPTHFHAHLHTFTHIITDTEHTHLYTHNTHTDSSEHSHVCVSALFSALTVQRPLGLVLCTDCWQCSLCFIVDGWGSPHSLCVFESLVLLCTQTVGDGDKPMSIKAAADEYDLDEDVHDLIVSASPCVQETHTHSHTVTCTVLYSPIHTYVWKHACSRSMRSPHTYPLTVMCTHQHSDTT